MGQASSWWHEAVLPGEAVSVLKARRFVCVHLVEHRLLYLVDDVRLVVSELAANAVRHAESPFKVSLGQTDRAVMLAVQDGSPRVPALLAPEVSDTAGRGVSMVDLVSEDWGVTQGPGGGKSVWASFCTR
jgi:hypothetical protein